MRLSLALLAGLAGLATRLVGGPVVLESLRPVQVNHWQTSEGLPHHDVTSIAPTPNGYLWVGTKAVSNSLVRYNGIEFIPAMDVGGSDGYRGVRLVLGREGRLWVSTDSAKGGGTLYLRQAGKTTRVEVDLPPAMAGLYEDRQGCLWIGGDGLMVRTPAGQLTNYSALAKDYGHVW